jgi:uncharacterized protein (DUF952 family)
MNSDLIFCPVSKRKWKEYNTGGYYRPKIDEEDVDTILCATNRSINQLLNDKFSGRKNLLILVIDKSRLEPKISQNSDSGEIFVNGAINTDAILDKIRISCNEDGQFDIEVESV